MKAEILKEIQSSIKWTHTDVEFSGQKVKIKNLSEAENKVVMQETFEQTGTKVTEDLEDKEIKQPILFSDIIEIKTLIKSAYFEDGTKVFEKEDFQELFDNIENSEKLMKLRKQAVKCNAKELSFEDKKKSTKENTSSKKQ